MAFSLVLLKSDASSLGFFLLLGLSKCVNPFYNVLANIVKESSENFFSGSVYGYVILVGALYMALAGRMTPRLSLSPIVALFFHYYASGLAEWIKKYESLSFLNGIIEMYESSVPLMAISCILFSIMIIYLVSLVSALLALLTAYLFNRMFVLTYLQAYKERHPVVYYGSLVIFGLIIFILSGLLVDLFFILLFSATGSFVFLTSIELLSKIEMGFDDLILNLKDEFNDVKSMFSVAFFVWIGVSLFGMFIQSRYVKSINHL